MRANVLQEILIDGQTAGTGTPSVEISDIHGKVLLTLTFVTDQTTFDLIIQVDENRLVFDLEVKEFMLLNLLHKSKVLIISIFSGVINPFEEGNEDFNITKKIFIDRFFSPFNVQVLPHFEPHKVIVDGPGIRNGIPASLETYFRIDTREAGFEHPDVLIKVS